MAPDEYDLSKRGISYLTTGTHGISLVGDRYELPDNEEDDNEIENDDPRRDYSMNTRNRSVFSLARSVLTSIGDRYNSILEDSADHLSETNESNFKSLYETRFLEDNISTAKEFEKKIALHSVVKDEDTAQKGAREMQDAKAPIPYVEISRKVKKEEEESDLSVLRRIFYSGICSRAVCPETFFGECRPLTKKQMDMIDERTYTSSKKRSQNTYQENASNASIYSSASTASYATKSYSYLDESSAGRRTQVTSFTDYESLPISTDNPISSFDFDNSSGIISSLPSGIPTLDEGSTIFNDLNSYLLTYNEQKDKTIDKINNRHFFRTESSIFGGLDDASQGDMDDQQALNLDELQACPSTDEEIEILDYIADSSKAPTIDSCLKNSFDESVEREDIKREILPNTENVQEKDPKIDMEKSHHSNKAHLHLGKLDTDLDPTKQEMIGRNSTQLTPTTVEDTSSEEDNSISSDVMINSNVKHSDSFEEILPPNEILNIHEILLYGEGKRALARMGIKSRSRNRMENALKILSKKITNRRAKSKSTRSRQSKKSYRLEKIEL